jgi:hypothetical protein
LELDSFALATVFVAANNWWEPGTPGILDIGDISIYFAALLAFSAIAAGFSRLWMKALRRVIKEEIGVATAPIHPNANGGLSLADVARKTTGLEASVKKIGEHNDETRTLLLQVLANSVFIPDVPLQEGSKKQIRKAAPRPRKKDD